MTEPEKTSTDHHPRVLRSVSVVSLMTAISRTGGLVREMAMAYFFGTSALKSAFDIAFTLPNLFRRLFGEGALASAFVPVFSESLEKDGQERAGRLAMRIITLLITFLGLLTLGGILISFPVERALAPDSRWLIPLPLMRIMLPYALFICVAALLSGMLNTVGRFAVSSITPFLLNLVWVATLVGLFPFLRNEPGFRIRVLSWMILCAGLAQILFQLPALSRSGFRLQLCFSGFFHDKKLRRVLTLMAPAALGMGLIQINVCVDKLLAFWADAAAPAALEYAERIVYLPLGMFGTAFMTVLLPTFSRQVSRGDLVSVRDTLERALRHLAVIMAPCSAALVFLALPVIELIYSIKGGSFDHTSAVLSARALAAYAPGLLVFSFQKALIPAFYGLQDLRTPMRVSLVGLLLNLTLNILCVWLLPHGWKHVGIAGATVFTSAANGLMLAVILHKRLGTPRASKLIGPVVRAIVAALVMALGAFYAHAATLRAALAADCPTKAAQILAISVTGILACAVYGTLMMLLNRNELREMVGEFYQRRTQKGS